MKVIRKIIEIDEARCDGCGQCVPACAEGAIDIVDGVAKVVADKYCDGLGACLGECPNDALNIIEREADEFDEIAVETLLAEKQKPPEAVPVCQCASVQLKDLRPRVPQMQDDGSDLTSSALTHWPIKIRLVPPSAPFLKGADLLVLADCGALAHPNLHQTLLKDKVVLMGCPKFDDIPDYIQKFTEIFQAGDIKSVSVVNMEVPCCSGMPVIVQKGMRNANKAIKIRHIILSAGGKIIEDKTF